MGLLNSYQVYKAKRRHKKAHPFCEVCGHDGTLLKPNEVHHVLPVHAYPDRATDPLNLVTLCRWHHFWVGHCFNWKRWNQNFWATSFAVAEAFRKHVRMEEKR